MTGIDFCKVKMCGFPVTGLFKKTVALLHGKGALKVFPNEIFLIRMYRKPVLFVKFCSNFFEIGFGLDSH